MRSFQIHLLLLTGSLVCPGECAPETLLNLGHVLFKVSQTVLAEIYSCLTLRIWAPAQLTLINLRDFHVLFGFANRGVFYQHYWRQADPHPEDFASMYFQSLVAFQNQGTFVFNYTNAVIKPRLYVGSEGRFSNTGYMYIEVGGEPRSSPQCSRRNDLCKFTEDPDVQFAVTQIFSNSGCMTFIGTGQDVLLVVFRPLTPATDCFFHKKSVIYLKNAYVSVFSGVSHSGCFLVMEKSTLELYFPNKVSRTQMIFMSVLESVLLLHTTTSAAKIAIFGFGPGSTVRFTQRMRLIAVTRGGGWELRVLPTSGSVKVYFRSYSKSEILFDGSSFSTATIKPSLAIPPDCQYDPSVVHKGWSRFPSERPDTSQNQ